MYIYIHIYSVLVQNTHIYIYIYIYIYTQYYSPGLMGGRFVRTGLLGGSIGERVVCPPPPSPVIRSDWIVIGSSKSVRSCGVSLLIIVRSFEAREWSSAKYHVALLCHLINWITCNSHPQA